MAHIQFPGSTGKLFQAVVAFTPFRFTEAFQPTPSVWSLTVKLLNTPAQLNTFLQGQGSRTGTRQLRNRTRDRFRTRFATDLRTRTMSTLVVQFVLCFPGELEMGNKLNKDTHVKTVFQTSGSYNEFTLRNNMRHRPWHQPHADIIVWFEFEQCVNGYVAKPAPQSHRRVHLRTKQPRTKRALQHHVP